MKNRMSNKFITIEEHMNSFKKHLWGNTKPMDFASDVVEELLLEIQRQRTVMRAALDEIDRFWKVHEELAEKNEERVQLINLMESLNSQRKGFYAQYLSPDEYSEFIKRSTSMDVIAKLEESNDSEQE